MDAKTEKSDAASIETPEDDEENYRVLNQQKISFLHIHVGLSTRKPAIINKFISDFNVFLTECQHGAIPLQINGGTDIEIERRTERWPARQTSLGLMIHTTDFLSEEQSQAFDEALCEMLNFQPIVVWGRWHEGGVRPEMSTITIPVEG